MSKNKFHIFYYLDKFIARSSGVVDISLENCFYLITKDEINKSEKTLGHPFPKFLKFFWLKIGEGHLTRSMYSNKKPCMLNNHLFGPKEIAEMITDIKENGEDNNSVLPEVYEYFEEGYIDLSKNEFIFFEIADSSSFLVMKPESKYPDGVYDMVGNLIEERFEDFIYKLYHVSPDYYLKE